MPVEILPGVDMRVPLSQLPCSSISQDIFRRMLGPGCEVPPTVSCMCVFGSQLMVLECKAWLTDMGH